jgi:hypothetical protein
MYKKEGRGSVAPGDWPLISSSLRRCQCFVSVLHWNFINYFVEFLSTGHRLGNFYYSPRVWNTHYYELFILFYFILFGSFSTWYFLFFIQIKFMFVINIFGFAKKYLSYLQYYYFVRLMGRKASHVALECALQSHANMVWNPISNVYSWLIYMQIYYIFI